MLTPSFTRQFERDLRRAQSRGKDAEKLKQVIRLLVAEQRLPERCRDHKLVGNWLGRRECHIEPDWLLIYRIAGEKITFERTGSHSDLFE